MIKTLITTILYKWKQPAKTIMERHFPMPKHPCHSKKGLRSYKIYRAKAPRYRENVILRSYFYRKNHVTWCLKRYGMYKYSKNQFYKIKSIDPLIGLKERNTSEMYTKLKERKICIKIIIIRCSNFTIPFN